MMVMSLIHHHEQQQQKQQQQQQQGLIKVMVLFILIIFSECLLEQRRYIVGAVELNSELATTQQQLLQSIIPKSQSTKSEESQLPNDEQLELKQVPSTIGNKHINNESTAKTSTSTLISISKSSPSSSSTSSTFLALPTFSTSAAASNSSFISASTKVAAVNDTKYYGGNFEDKEQSSAEDGIALLGVLPTTYRPVRPHTSAQERERKLMNVLAARRNALNRGRFRTRIGTTGRTATSSGSMAVIETTSKAPADPRSICIRNCTKNFTRRTTASCMRQCASFARTPTTTTNVSNNSNTTKVIIRPSSKTGINTSRAVISEQRDTNEILFTDESSHGLFVVTKEQNDTLNHIPDANKGSKNQRTRSKPTTTSSIEDDDLQPYLFFGQKLPPIKPNSLTITSVSDEHPKLLEVSVAHPRSTTSLPTVASAWATSSTSTAAVPTSTLSEVERSRSRYKYHMRERGTNSFNWRGSSNSNINRGFLRNNAGLINDRTSTTPVTTTTIRQMKTEFTHLNATEPITSEALKDIAAPNLASRLGMLNSMVSTTQPNIVKLSTPLLIQVISDEDQELPSTTAKPRATSTTTTTTTSAPSTKYVSSSTLAATTTTSTVPTTTTMTTTTPRPSPTPLVELKTIEAEENFTPIHAVNHDLHINDDQANIIIFFNQSTTTTSRPSNANDPPTTDATSTILRTTILTSIRSTVNPRIESTLASINKLDDDKFSNAVSPATNFIGIVETAHASTNLKPLTEINSTTLISAETEDVSYDADRMNIATMVLAIIGIFPLMAIILYLVRTYIIRRHTKNDEDFDVCIGDQQPISPVKKLESLGHHINDDDFVIADEIDNHQTIVEQHTTHTQTQTIHQLHESLGNGKRHYDDHGSLTSEQELDRSNIRLKSLLGEGNFGQVWKAEADDLKGHFGATRIVAVKTIRALSAQVSLKEEAAIMRKLGSHPNVVTLLGACVESEPHMLIMEYAMRGRLLSLLRAARNATNILPASVPGGRSLAPLSPRTLAGFAMDIACGMEYIASRRIVHRDLAARNVLLDHNGVCKICDFGMSIDLEIERKRKEQEKLNTKEVQRNHSNKFSFDFAGRFILNHWHPQQTQQNQKEKEVEKKTSHHNHGGGGGGHDTISKRHALPIRWMAPEALQYHIFTTETDIWAFGIVLWEIATLGSTPYSQYTGREVIRRVPNGLRPDLPKESRHEFYNLMSRCWHKNPHMRPTFTQSRQEISRTLHKWVDDDSAASDYMDVSGFSEDLEQGMVYFNHRISEFECEI